MCTKAKKTITEYDRAIDSFRDVLRAHGESTLGTPAQAVEALCARHAEHLGKIAEAWAEERSSEGTWTSVNDPSVPGGLRYDAAATLRAAVKDIGDLKPKSTVLDGEQQQGEW